MRANAPIAHPPYRHGCQQHRPDAGVVGGGPILPVLQEYALAPSAKCGTAAPGSWPSPRTAWTSRAWRRCNPGRAGNGPAVPGTAAIAPRRPAPPASPFPESAQTSLPPEFLLLNPISARQDQQDQPGRQDRLRPARQHLHRARHRPPDQRSAAFAPGPLPQPHHPRQPTEGRHVARPHQEVERQPVEGEDHPRQPRRQPVVRPALGQEIHPQPAPEQVRQAEERQRPRQRQQQVDEREGVKRQRVPLGQEGEAAVVERIPERQLAPPKALPMESRPPGS